MTQVVVVDVVVDVVVVVVVAVDMVVIDVVVAATTSISHNSIDSHMDRNYPSMLCFPWQRLFDSFLFL